MPPLQQHQQTASTTRRHHHPVRDCLLYDFYSAFLKGQTIAQNVQGGSVRLEGALLLSKRYKAAMKRAVKMLEQPANNEGQSQATVQQLGEELCSAEMLWALIEAVSIRPSQNLLSVDLLEWARECFSPAQSVIPSGAQAGQPAGASNFLGAIMEELMQREQPELHESYWNAVIRQALCADFPTVATLLQFHSAFKRDEALGKMAKILTTANVSLLNHDRTNCDGFLTLQKKVRDLVAQKQLFRVHDNLGVICSLLIGDKGTFRKYFDLFRPNWFEVLPAFLLYFCPMADGEQMPKIIEGMFTVLGLQRQKLTRLEQTVLAILELDLIQALKLICSRGRSVCWFAAHLVDLLHFHDPAFLNPFPNSIVALNFTSSLANEQTDLNLRSRLLIEYGQLLFEDGQHWEIGADYLMASGVPNAGEMLDRLVAKLSWHDNTAMAERLVTVCDRFELCMAREDILRDVAMKFCRQGEWSTALHWALRMHSGGGNELAAQVARRILQGAIPASRIGKMRIFDSMAEQFMESAELVLLYKFYTFKRYLADGELRQAAQLLHELFLDNSSPTEFHVTLCQELVHMLGTFQQHSPISQHQSVPGLERDAVQNVFRALSKFQLQQNLLKVATAGEKQQQHSGGAANAASLFPSTTPATALDFFTTNTATTTLPSMEVYEQLTSLMCQLRPMLAEALANCSLH